jgi:hypothetical protein
MTYSDTISDLNNIDALPRPTTISACDLTVSALPRPVSSQPNIADSGRISFGAGLRIRSSK